jgi:hypothetical protein
LLVSSSISLKKLHDVLRVRLDQVLIRERDSMIYEYDFGDSWTHKIVLERVLASSEGFAVPSCVAGARACPPEDCGGVWDMKSY